MKNIPAEIIKEYRVHVEGLEYPIKARIIKSLSGNDEHLFLGELSHYCRQNDTDAEVYRPSLVRQNLDQVESLLIQYLERFTTLNITENKYY